MNEKVLDILLTKKDYAGPCSNLNVHLLSLDSVGEQKSDSALKRGIVKANYQYINKAAALVQGISLVKLRRICDRQTSIQTVKLKLLIDEVYEKMKEDAIFIRNQGEELNKARARIVELEARVKDYGEVCKAVAHIGVDWGYGEYILEDKIIDKARHIYEHDDSLQSPTLSPPKG